MNVYQQYLDEVPDTTDGPDVSARVDRVREAIQASFERSSGQPNHDFHVAEMERFLSFLTEQFPKGRFHTRVQTIPKHLVRTTNRNFVVTVPGQSSESIVLVAHYDTWAGFSRKAPGADDNTTGEEILKQYLLQDLQADAPPPLTHIYLFAGSEECGTRGLVSQMGLTVALSSASGSRPQTRSTYWPRSRFFH